MKTQFQLYHEERQRLASANAAFLAMVRHPTNPLTRADLERLIAKRPASWSRFAAWLSKLPA